MPTPKKTAKKVTAKKKSADEAVESVESTTAAESAAGAPAAETSGKTKTSAKAVPATQSDAATAKAASTTQATSSQAAPPQAAAPKPASQIDAGAHAHSAVASLLASRNKQAQGGTAATPAANESAAFKKLKEGLGKPSIGSNSPIGGNTGFPRTGGHSNQFNRQPLHRQAFNANSNRTGVPRRTSGG